MFGSVRLCTIVSAARLVAIIIAGFPEDCPCRAHATSTSTSTPSPPPPHTKCNPTNHCKLQATHISNNGQAYAVNCSFGSLKKWACLHVTNLRTHRRLHILPTVKGWNDYINDVPRTWQEAVVGYFKWLSLRYFHIAVLRFLTQCMYVCMYVCMYAYKHVCMYVYVCMHVCMYVCMYFYVCMYACMYVCMYVCTLCMCVYVCM
jgi:hypothetical protein